MCKLALCGLSPLELLRSTKSIHDVYRVLGPEYRLRAPDAAERAEWAGLSQRDRDAYGYEYDLRQVLERLVAECDRRIARGHERVEREAQALPWTAEEEAEREDLERREEEALVLAQALGEAGDIDGAQGAVLQAEGLQRLQLDLERKHCPRASVSVCEISGIFLSVEETAKGHDLEGRQYKGWKRIREKLEELQERNPPPASRRGSSRGGTREQGHHHRGSYGRGGDERGRGGDERGREAHGQRQRDRARSQRLY